MEQIQPKARLTVKPASQRRLTASASSSAVLCAPSVLLAKKYPIACSEQMNVYSYATQPMIDKPLDQLRYKKPIEDSLIIYGQACSKSEIAL